MIKLDYTFSSSWRGKSASLALGTATEWVLRYDCFLGDVTFLVDDVDLSVRWGWVPILDFALSLEAIVDSLGHVDADTFEFTESDATIVFRRHGDVVQIEASYIPDTARVAYEDLRTTVKHFVVQVLDDVMRNFPDVTQNPSLVRVIETRASNEYQDRPTGVRTTRLAMARRDTSRRIPARLPHLDEFRSPRRQCDHLDRSSFWKGSPRELRSEMSRLQGTASQQLAP